MKLTLVQFMNFKGKDVVFHLKMSMRNYITDDEVGHCRIELKNHETL